MSHSFKIVLLDLGMCLIIGFCCNSINAIRIKYDNYQVYEVYPQKTDDLKLVEDLEASSDSVIILQYNRNCSIELGRQPINMDMVVVVVVAPHKENDFVGVLNDIKMPYKLVERNLQRVLDLEANEKVPTTRYQGEYDWKKYHTLEETYQWLESLAAQYPDTITLLVGGKSYEGRNIMGVKLSYKSGNKAIFMEGGIHAREWISPATVTYILHELLTSYDSQVRRIAENYDWYVFPHFNPDGYVYTHTSDRLWRKTRSRVGFCYGTDLNRNWNFHWRETGASWLACSETFAGQSAFSEIESRTMSQFIESLSRKSDLRTYLAFHSFSQLLLFPYGHTREHAENHDDLQAIGEVAAEALSKRYGTLFNVGNIYDAIYPSAGGSMDWAYGTLDIPIAFTYELRPKGGWNGFVLSPSQIIPTGKETLDSVVALINEADRLGYYE